MLIINQERDRAINMKPMTDLCIVPYNDLFYVNMIRLRVKDINLGKYSTYERAKEVLFKIVDEYKNRIPDQNTVFYMPEE